MCDVESAIIRLPVLLLYSQGAVWKQSKPFTNTAFSARFSPVALPENCRVRVIPPTVNGELNQDLDAIYAQ